MVSASIDTRPTVRERLLAHVARWAGGLHLLSAAKKKRTFAGMPLVWKLLGLIAGLNRSLAIPEKKGQQLVAFGMTVLQSAPISAQRIASGFVDQSAMGNRLLAAHGTYEFTENHDTSTKSSEHLPKKFLFKMPRLIIKGAGRGWRGLATLVRERNASCSAGVDLRRKGALRCVSLHLRGVDRRRKGALRIVLFVKKSDASIVPRQDQRRRDRERRRSLLAPQNVGAKPDCCT